MDRMRVVFGHIGNKSISKGCVGLREIVNVSHDSLKQFPDADDDIVVVNAVRTPIGKAKRGSFKDTFPDDLLSAVFTAVIKQSGISPTRIGDICVGCVSDPYPALTARLAQFYSGIPETVPVSSVNRLCSSGLQAFMNIAGSIRSGICDIGLAGGVESMTKNSADGRDASRINPRVFEVDNARNCLVPMGLTSENVASRFGITREKQDQFSLESQQKAALATRLGKFNDEIIPITTKIIDKDGQEKVITVTKDDGIRPDTTFEGLSKLKPVFQADGSTTAGNSSQLSDGAAAMLVAKRSAAQNGGLPILGVLRACSVIGCPPDIMGIGPSIAIPEVLKKAGLTVDDIDIFEINEAFASQAVYCVEKLKIPADKLNPNGGAIAFGHPLGCTGARMIATLLHELKRRRKRAFGIVSMCVGSGMGMAALFEYPGNR